MALVVALRETLVHGVDGALARAAGALRRGAVAADGDDDGGGVCARRGDGDAGADDDAGAAVVAADDAGAREREDERAHADERHDLAQEVLAEVVPVRVADRLRREEPRDDGPHGAHEQQRAAPDDQREHRAEPPPLRAPCSCPWALPRSVPIVICTTSVAVVADVAVMTAYDTTVSQRIVV